MNAKMASRNPLEKIEVLDSIEKDIITCLQSAGKFSSFLFLNTFTYFLSRSSSSGTRKG